MMPRSQNSAAGQKPRCRTPWRNLRVLFAALLIEGAATSPLGAQISSDIPLPHDPAHADRARHWCGIHLARDELVAALSDCDYAIAFDPKDATALSNRGSVWLAANEPARALLDFDAAIAISPEPGFYFNRGIAHGQLGARQHAIDDYTEAIRLKPDFAFAYHNRGVELEQQGSRAEATADFERALKIDPDLAPSRQALQRLNPP